jgi:7,8-dihydro-6-hydroxymethylpterin-pyrophosphokinase
VCMACSQAIQLAFEYISLTRDSKLNLDYSVYDKQARCSSNGTDFVNYCVWIDDFVTMLELLGADSN